MASHRQITLRNVKGTALTYAEMDQNLSSFFYSASLSSTDLLLHYTGSSVLGAPYTPTSVTVPLNPLLATITQLTVAGTQVGDIQYRINNSTLGADSSFKWDTVNYRLGVGVGSPVATLDVMQLDAANPSRIRITTQNSSISNQTAALELYLGNTFLGSFGKTGNRPDIYTIVGNGTRSAFTTIGTTNVVQTNSVGVGIFATPNNALTVKGIIGVGSDTFGAQGLIGSINNKVLITSLPTGAQTAAGLLIESPKSTGTAVAGGHVIVGINQTSNNSKYAFSVLAGLNGAYTTPILTATAEGKIGINKNSPTQALDIVGNTVMSGSLTIGTVTDSLGANAQVLTRNSTTGLVQYTTNIMPLGGIIMWSGSPTILPTGWALCDGTGSVNGSPIPDLRERFIVGAGGNNPDVVIFDYNTFTMFTQFQFTSGFAIINGTFTKISDASGVSGGLFRTATNETGGNPTLFSQYALYSLTGATPATSYYIVFNYDYRRYRIYRGNVPANLTDLSNATNHPYVDLPYGAWAQLKQEGSFVTFRPNYIDLSWVKSSSGYAVGDKGGFNNVDLQISEMPSHNHEYQDAFYAENNGGGAGLAGSDEGFDGDNNPIYRYENPGGSSFTAPPAGRRPTTYYTGGDFPHENRPPYYALAFIIYTGI